MNAYELQGITDGMIKDTVKISEKERNVMKMPFISKKMAHSECLRSIGKSIEYTKQQEVVKAAILMTLIQWLMITVRKRLSFNKHKTIEFSSN